jgi:adenosylhomocysteine nucleosidase
MSPAGRQRAAAHAGLVASGDQFIVSAAVSGQITADLQAAGHAPWRWRWKVRRLPRSAPTTVCRLPPCAPSDRADDSAHVDFPAFVQAVASRYALQIVQHWVQQG